MILLIRLIFNKTQTFLVKKERDLQPYAFFYSQSKIYIQENIEPSQTLIHLVNKA